MNTILVAICTFSAGLIIGATTLAVCNSGAFEFQDNPSTRWDMQQMQLEQQRLRDQQEQYQYQERRRNPCP